jgi:hypothetical protein
LIAPVNPPLLLPLRAGAPAEAPVRRMTPPLLFANFREGYRLTPINPLLFRHKLFIAFFIHVL